MKKYTAAILFYLGIICNIQAQELFYLEEGFESPQSISRWTNYPIIPNKEWKYTYGGQWESGGDPYNPEIPWEGNLNAGLYFPSLDLDTVKLISPTLELAGSGKPTLRFYHCQYEKIFKGPDFLRLFFRAGPNSDWDLIQEWTSDISYWKDEVFDIEDIDENYLTDTFQLAFEGIIGNGYGVYVDAVSVREDTIVQKFVKSVTYNSVEYDAIPAGATDIPLEEIVIRILGNTGDAILDSLSIIPTGGGISHLETDSFKLYYSIDNVFAPFKGDTSTLIATASLNGGTVTFADIDHEMRLGDNHYWVAASFKQTLAGKTNLKFTVPADGINVMDTLLPVSDKILNRTHWIYETAFYDNFETGASGWTLEDNFEVGWPEGTQVSTQKNPESPYNGTNILATDLDGGYYPGITSGTEYYAYMPEIDLTYYTNIGLYMQSYFAINGPDEAVIEYSVDGGSEWQNLWTSNASNNNSSWTEFYDQSIADIAKRKSQFQIRFGIVESQTIPWPGFSVDNFAIIAEKIHTDVGITEIVEPNNHCIGCGNDSIKIWVRNYADGNAPGIIPVYYGLWGLDSVLVQDTIFGGINKDDSTLFTFSKPADFPQGDFYDKLIVGINLSNDQDPLNDTLSKPVTIQKYSSPYHFEDFEYKGGIWLPSEGSTWENKDMTGTIPTDPESPHIWVLSPTGNYPNNEVSDVESGCYDLSDLSRNVIQFKYWSDCEEGKDGTRMEYTINNGDSWQILNDAVNGLVWNWTTDMVEALGTSGWTGINEWTTARAIIPVHADTAKNVKLRIVFMSNATIAHAQGFAFNDLSVFNAPPDVGVSAIDIPEDACQYEYPNEISLWVKNYGYNDLMANDTMIIGYDFESEPAVIDTFLLSSDLVAGDSTMFTIPTLFDATAAGTYQISAYTLIEDDPFFYVTNNDTTTKIFEVWLSPITDLADTMSSRQPDTLVIEPYYDPVYDYLWGDMSTNPTYDVSYPGTYYLTVTESTHGCQTFDSVYIQLLYADVGIDSIIWPQSSCELSNTENIQVQIRNIGTDSLIVDDKILLYYEFNSGPPVADSITLTESLLSGRTLWFTFEGRTEDLSVIGDYSIKTYTDYGGDTVATNDTLSRTISVYGYPTLNLGNDTIINGLTYDLQADPGFDIYLWDNGETTSNRLIDTSGYYWLDVWDIHGCPATDSIDIWFRIHDVSPQMLVNPVSSCEREGTETVTVRIVNSGSDTLYASDDIDISYNLDGGAWTNQTINISQLLPGQTYDYTYAPTHDLSALGTYTFNLTAYTAGDMRENNDTLIVDVYTSTNPVVDLGVTEDVYYVPELVLDAGFGENYSYLWHDGSTEQTYTVTDITTVEVLVTDNLTGCYGGDTAFVYLDIKDYIITNVDIDDNACSGTYENVAVTLLNNGNLPREGATITLEYSQNDNYLFTEQFENIGNWPAGASRIHTTRNDIDMNDLGPGELEIEITSDGDLRPENDIFTHEYEIIPSPDVDFGGSQLQVDFPYILDAGSGHSSYLWSTGATSSSITVTAPGTYSVTVTGSNGCLTNKSVFVDTVLALSPGAESEMSISIYPNPTNDFITIEAYFENPGDYILEVFNAQNSLFISREIYEAEYREEFYFGDLPSGLYFIRFRNSKFYYVSKMIVQ